MAQPNMDNLRTSFNMASTELRRFENLPAMVLNLQLQHILEQIQGLYNRFDDTEQRLQLLQTR